MDEMKLLEAIKEMMESQTARVEQKIEGLSDKVDKVESELKSEMVELREEMHSLSDKVERNFQATRSEIVDAVEAVGRKVDSLDHSIKDMETVTAQNAYDVQLMKRRA